METGRGAAGRRKCTHETTAGLPHHAPAAALRTVQCKRCGGATAAAVAAAAEGRCLLYPPQKERRPTMSHQQPAALH